MKRNMSAGIKRGQAITFRLPSDTPDHIIRQLQHLKETEKRNFSSKIAQFVLEGVGQSLTRERETITIPLPKPLSKEQRNWLKHAHSEALLGNIIYQLLRDPIRATTVLASLNSNALDIDEALYLQEENITPIDKNETDLLKEKEVEIKADHDFEDELMNLDWEEIREEQASSIEVENLEEEEDLLDDFLSQMNK
ncbi:hypothetical protein J2S13_001750 [Oikeobacillus pervagus]|uniref:Uncharacterized protein n=1 Tax=Oikeobacillus pervagus TaxID=1325931 RepID=A0AAJ1T194_9BACI|nr:hypothetical protein [Oikeobacillus pervagus]MDQ0215337.1 hypothetical protein [Oikeobacillus pervagus]